MSKLLLIVLTFCTFTHLVYGSVPIDTINISYGDLKIDQLLIGSTTYLTYTKHNQGKMMQMQLWHRKTSLLNDRILVEQIWEGEDSTKNRELYSLSEKADFSPLFHSVDFGDKIEAYDFHEGRIAASDSVALNTRAGFERSLPESCFNFELDLEILQTLPYENGKTYLINFYHPGGKSAPQQYAYQVTAFDETSQCWMVDIDYPQGSSARFWVHSEQHTVIKMQESYGPIQRYKILLP